MKKKSDNPDIRSFKEFKDSVKLVRKADMKGFCAGQNTYQFLSSGFYVHAKTLKGAYQYYQDHNLWFDPDRPLTLLERIGKGEVEVIEMEFTG